MKLATAVIEQAEADLCETSWAVIERGNEGDLAAALLAGRWKGGARAPRLLLKALAEYTELKRWFAGEQFEFLSATVGVHPENTRSRLKGFLSLPWNGRLLRQAAEAACSNEK